MKKQCGLEVLKLTDQCVTQDFVSYIWSNSKWHRVMAILTSYCFCVQTHCVIGGTLVPIPPLNSRKRLLWTLRLMCIYVSRSRTACILSWLKATPCCLLFLLLFRFKGQIACLFSLMRPRLQVEPVCLGSCKSKQMAKFARLPWRNYCVRGS